MSDYFLDACPECISLNVRVLFEESLDTETQVEVKCQDCGYEWIDFIES